jgi:sugar lactone lactonase YvrE
MNGRALLLATLALAACKKKEAEKAPPANPPPAAVDAAAAPTTNTQEPPPPDDGRVVVKEGFATPESVLYDDANDVYIVSNINGSPAAADDNGYLAKVTPDGAVTKWIDGAAADVKLDAPKGSAIVAGTLYVADITVVRQFDAATGKQKADIPIPGATFLNDVAPAQDSVLVTDSGLDASFQPTGADAVYRISTDGKVTTVIKDKGLGAPNGVVAFGDQVWFNTFGSGEIVAVDAKGQKTSTSKPPKGKLDGFIADSVTGEVYVSSWEGSAVYKGSGKDSYTEVVTGVKSPADMGWDSKRKKLLVPLFEDNQLVIVAP